MKEGAIPCLNLPLKSFESIEKPRSQSSIEKRDQARNHDSHTETTSSYDTPHSPTKTFEDLKKELLKANLKRWVVEVPGTMISMKLIEKSYAVPKFELIVDMQMKVKYYDCFI